MEGQQKRGKKDPDFDIRLKELLVNWLVAVTDFYDHYKRVSLYLDYLHHTPHHQINWVDQCPTPQLMDLQATMRSELERLLLDMDQLDQHKHEKLASHTRLLRQLNQQVDLLLEQASLPAG